MTSDTSSPLSDNLEAILKPTGGHKEHILKTHSQPKGKYCLWHRNGEPTHWDNFGLMGECRDCLAEIERGRCSVDVCNFELDTYWNVRNFWLKVDINTSEQPRDRGVHAKPLSFRQNTVCLQGCVLVVPWVHR
jgi:hypothetical protein